MATLILIVEDEAKLRGILAHNFEVTARIFTRPSDKRTEDYVTGRFG